MTGRFLLAAFFIVAGLLHFIFPYTYLRMVPPILPWPGTLVWLSGAAEIIGGTGLLLPPWRRPAAWGLVLLLIAVFPANIYMAVAHVHTLGCWARAGRNGCACRCRFRSSTGRGATPANNRWLVLTGDLIRLRVV
jgi:uncharacterized membrane protein